MKVVRENESYKSYIKGTEVILQIESEELKEVN